ncbi:uncharacterized protein LOC135152399 [Daucus carota subsp. sativus]|uniref:uncharacterized protein LOC135152399 n=1 Tax=Daucus carota subsp. sativus TaxID=79200 RepID=UPI003083EAA1
MSAKDSFAAALRNLGGVHVPPKPQPKKKSGKKPGKKGESGSSRQGTEGTGQSSATPDATPDPKLRVEDPELVADAEEVESPVHEPKKKRKKTDSSQKQVIDMTVEDPGRSAMEVVDLGVEVGGGSRPAPKFGKYPVKKVLGLMSELPSDQDWEMMEDEGLATNFKEIGNLWGQLGGRLAGFNTHALNSLKQERDLSVKSLARVTKLEKDLDVEKSAREALESGVASKIKEAEIRKEAELNQKIKDAGTRADSAEKKVTGLEKEVADLKKLLEGREEPAKVIAEFQESTAYADALAAAGALEVVRCWHVAEQHIKTDPEASLQSFIELYLAAKDKIKAGKGEPDPYEGPSPSFLPPANPGVDGDLDSSSADSEPADETPVEKTPADETPADETLAD